MLLKLSRLKKYLTLEDSAKYLSLVTGGEVRANDLLQLAHTGQITLSIMLPSVISAVEYKRNDTANEFEPLDFGKNLEGLEALRAWKADLSAWVDQLVRADWILTTNTQTLYEPDFDNVHSIFNLWSFPCFHFSGNRLVIARELSRPFSLDKEYSNEDAKPCPIFVQNHDDQRIMCLVEYVGNSSDDDPEDEPEDEPEGEQEDESDKPTRWPKYARLTLPKDSFLCLKQDELQRFAATLNELESEVTTADSQPAGTNNDTELRSNQRALAALALGLTAKFHTYRKAGKPNASQLAKLATEHLRDEQNDRAPHGFSETSVRQTITDALKACPELKK